MAEERARPCGIAIKAPLVHFSFEIPFPFFPVGNYSDCFLEKREVQGPIPRRGLGAGGRQASKKPPCSEKPACKGISLSLSLEGELRERLVLGVWYCFFPPE